MTINVLAVEPLCDKAKCAASYNKSYEGVPDWPLLTEEAVCAATFRMYGWEDALKCCDEVMITCAPDEALLGLKIDEKSMYGLTDSAGRQFEMIVREAAPGQLRVKKGSYAYGELTPGMTELTCVFDYDRFPDLAKLAELGWDDLPSFHESRLELLSREGDTLRLYICDGVFTNINMTMTLTGVTREESRIEEADAPWAREENILTDDPWEYFRQRAHVGNVRLFSEEKGYRVKITDNKVYGSRHSGVHMEFTNELIIWCEGLELSFEKQKERPE